MEFDWSEGIWPESGGPSPQEVEESFEDPHGVRFIPDSPRFAHESRSFCLGRTLSGKGLFCVFWADGKRIRVLAARLMTPEEEYFYERKVQQWMS